MAWTGSESSYQGFIDKHGLTFPQIDDTSAAVYDRFGVSYQPALAIVKADGTVETVAGAVDGPLLDQIISEA